MISLEFDCPECGNMNEHNVRLENYGEYIDQDKETPFFVPVNCESCCARLHIRLELKVKVAPFTCGGDERVKRKKTSEYHKEINNIATLFNLLNYPQQENKG